MPLFRSKSQLHCITIVSPANQKQDCFATEIGRMVVQARDGSQYSLTAKCQSFLTTLEEMGWCYSRLGQLHIS